MGLFAEKHGCFQYFRKGGEVAPSAPKSSALPTGPHPGNFCIIADCVWKSKGEYFGECYRKFIYFDEKCVIINASQLERGNEYARSRQRSRSDGWSGWSERSRRSYGRPGRARRSHGWSPWSQTASAPSQNAQNAHVPQAYGRVLPRRGRSRLLWLRLRRSHDGAGPDGRCGDRHAAVLNKLPRAAKAARGGLCRGIAQCISTT